MRILVIEDEIKIANFTALALREMSYAVDLADSGTKAREFFEQYEYDLVILDIMLPDDDGVKLCQAFKRIRPEVPILMLTTLAHIHDKVRGLDSGANDYMTKPYHLEEFHARVRALLRRSDEKRLTLGCHDLELDLVKREAIRAGDSIKLTTKEFALLEYFLRNIGRPVSRGQISQHVWDLHFDPGSNVIDVYVRQLRKKIDSAYSKKLIKTIVGLGYAINDE